jgi:ATP-dependent helicase/nuclease subunit A
VIAEEKKENGLAEEMRILYVAMTRAKERLILTGVDSHDKCAE